MNGRSVVRAASKYYWHQCEELLRSIRRSISSSFHETSEGVEPFEKGYQEKEDPWEYATSPYELTKYRQTLDLLPPIPFDNALECACAEGSSIFWELIFHPLPSGERTKGAESSTMSVLCNLTSREMRSQDGLT
jgi:hypothetical protein